MATKSINDDDSKIMDISKPGTGKISSTSRPIITANKPVGSTETVTAPSASRKIIKPLSDEESVSETVEVTTDSESSNETVEINASENGTTETVDPVESEPTETTEPETSEVNNSEEPTKEEEPKESEKTSDGSSEAAGVNELAKAAETKKNAGKKAEEDAKRNDEVQKLIDSKKYVVPIGHSHISSKDGSKSKWLVIMLLVFAVLVAGYLVIDAKVVDNDIDLPYEFFKDKEVLVIKATTDSSEDEVQEDTAEEVIEETDQPSAEQQVAERDENRKDELKNLQQRLETYFNDNDSYVASLADLVPAPTTEELTGPQNEEYVYVASANNQSYTLSVKLENTNDTDANASGEYVLNSVNQ